MITSVVNQLADIQAPYIDLSRAQIISLTNSLFKILANNLLCYFCHEGVLFPYWELASYQLSCVGGDTGGKHCETIQRRDVHTILFSMNIHTVGCDIVSDIISNVLVVWLSVYECLSQRTPIDDSVRSTEAILS